MTLTGITGESANAPLTLGKSRQLASAGSSSKQGVDTQLSFSSTPRIHGVAFAELGATSAAGVMTGAGEGVVIRTGAGAWVGTGAVETLASTGTGVTFGVTITGARVKSEAGAVDVEVVTNVAAAAGTEAEVSVEDDAGAETGALAVVGTKAGPEAGDEEDVSKETEAGMESLGPETTDCSEGVVVDHGGKNLGNIPSKGFPASSYFPFAKPKRNVCTSLVQPAIGGNKQNLS